MSNIKFNTKSAIFVPKIIKDKVYARSKNLKNSYDVTDEAYRCNFKSFKFTRNLLSGKMSYFIQIFLSFVCFYFGLSAEEGQNLRSRWRLFMDIVVTLVDDFAARRLHAKYSNFTNKRFSLVLHEKNKKQNKNEDKIKKNKKKNQLKKKKVIKKNVGRRSRVRRLKDKYLNLISDRALVLQSGAELSPEVNAKSLEEIEAVKSSYSRYVLSRSARRKSGLDKAYARRLAKRREARGEPSDYKSDFGPVHFVTEEVFEVDGDQGSLYYSDFEGSE